MRVALNDTRDVTVVDADCRVKCEWLPQSLVALTSHLRQLSSEVWGVDFLEVEGEPPITACSAEWCSSFSYPIGPAGQLCHRSPVVFDSDNDGGGAAWGETARGAVVVARRGLPFELMAHHAERAGANALVVIDNQEIWDPNLELAQEKSSIWTWIQGTAPTVPTILVPKTAEALLCFSNRNLQATVVRRHWMSEVPRALKMKEQMNKFGSFVRGSDYLEVDGEASFQACAARWCGWFFVGKTLELCELAPVVFASHNANGIAPWGEEAKGAIVVALRGCSFELMAHNAAGAGAVALVVVDDNEIFDDNTELTQENPPIRHEPPSVTTVLVPRKAEQLLCSGRKDLKAKLVRRREVASRDME